MHAPPTAAQARALAPLRRPAQVAQALRVDTDAVRQVRALLMLGRGLPAHGELVDAPARFVEHRPLRVLGRGDAARLLGASGFLGLPGGLGAPAAANPLAEPPHPPTGDARVEVLGVLPHPLPELHLGHQPAVPGVQVRLVDGPVRVARHLVRCRRECPPEVGEVAVQVVDGLHARRRGPAQQDSEAAGERLHVVGDVPEGRPHQMGSTRLAPEPREGSPERSAGGAHAALLFFRKASARRRTRFSSVSRRSMRLACGSRMPSIWSRLMPSTSATTGSEPLSDTRK